MSTQLFSDLTVPIHFLAAFQHFSIAPISDSPLLSFSKTYKSLNYFQLVLSLRSRIETSTSLRIVFFCFISVCHYNFTVHRSDENKNVYCVLCACRALRALGVQGWRSRGLLIAGRLAAIFV